MVFAQYIIDSARANGIGTTYHSSLVVGFGEKK